MCFTGKDLLCWQALNELTLRLYKELRQLAAGYMRKERAGHTLEPAALVNKAYVRLLEQNEKVLCQNRSHFLAIAARLMRQILVDHARRRQTNKRGGQRVGLNEAICLPTGATADLISLDSWLEALRSVDPRKCRAVDLCYFAGLTAHEIARVLDVSSKTVRRDLAMAEAWLYQRMRQESRA